MAGLPFAKKSSPVPKKKKKANTLDFIFKNATKVRPALKLTPQAETKIIEKKIYAGPPGKRGEKGESPTREELILLIKPLLPKAIKGDRGNKGDQGEMPSIEQMQEVMRTLIPEPVKDENGVLQTNKEALIREILTLVPQKENVTAETLIAAISELKGDRASEFGKKIGAMIDISYIRNAQSFLFNGKKYKFEELMHGGGSSTTSGLNVATQYILTAIQSGSDVTISLAQLTHFATFDAVICLYRNNIPQTEGASYDFTISGSIITVHGADSSEIFNLTYSYT